MVGVLCALLGFALVVQVSQTQEDQLSSLRQSDLVRLLDDVTQRSGELEDQVSSLEATRDELQSGSGRERAALELAEQQAETLGILSGRLPAAGPGVEIEVVEGAEPLEAFGLFNVLEELRNAGAEAMEVNGVRLVASSYFEDTSDGVVVDGQVIVPVPVDRDRRPLDARDRARDPRRCHGVVARRRCAHHRHPAGPGRGHRDRRAPRTPVRDPVPADE